MTVEGGVGIVHDALTTWLDARIPTLFLGAGETSPSHVGAGGGSAAYKRVDPEHRGMGANFFQVDIGQVTVRPTQRLDSGRTSINTSFGMQRGNRPRQRPAVSERLIGNVNPNWDPNRRFRLHACSFSVSGFAPSKGARP